MTQRHWTLAVVCAATAMLMLDIAVVNTALSRIADDLDAGLGGLQWVVDAYTLALAATVLTAGSLADRFGRRRLFTAGLAFSPLASAACAASDRHRRCSIAARAVQGIGAAIMFAVSLALLADAFPGAKERAGRSPPTARRSAPRSPSARSSAARSPAASTGGGSSSSTCRSASPASGSPARTCAESRDPRARRVDVPGQVALSSRPVPARARAAARQRGRLGQHADRRRAGRRGGPARRVRRDRARVTEPMLPLGLFRNPLHRRADRGVRDLRLVLRDVPLHHAVPAAGARAVGDRGRPRLPARRRS